MTYLELCKRVRAEAGVSGTGPATTRGQTGILGLIVSWVRQADLDIQNNETSWRFHWRRAQGVNTVAKREEYLPADLGMEHPKPQSRNIERAVVGGVRLRVVEWEDYVADIETLGRVDYAPIPHTITVTPLGKIKFYPVPDTVQPVYIDYYTSTTPLAGDNDVSPIPTEYHEAIAAKALMYYGLSENDQAAFNNAQVMYEEQLNRLEHGELPSVKFTHESAKGAFNVI